MTAPEPTDTHLDEAVGSAETPDGSAATPEGLRMDVVAEGEMTALLPTGGGDLCSAHRRLVREPLAGGRPGRAPGDPAGPAVRRGADRRARQPGARHGRGPHRVLAAADPALGARRPGALAGTARPRRRRPTGLRIGRGGGPACAGVGGG